jgi:hypothetical protein
VFFVFFVVSDLNDLIPSGPGLPMTSISSEVPDGAFASGLAVWNGTYHIILNSGDLPVMARLTAAADHQEPSLGSTAPSPHAVEVDSSTRRGRWNLPELLLEDFGVGSFSS